MARSSRNSRPKSRNSQSRRRKAKPRNRIDPRKFWGDLDSLLADESPPINLTTNPVAVVKSLGRPPLSGQQNASDHYFAAVYDRAVNLGAALAAAGNLIEADDLTGD